jgi:hypothetical protein
MLDGVENRKALSGQKPIWFESKRRLFSNSPMKMHADVRFSSAADIFDWNNFFLCKVFKEKRGMWDRQPFGSLIAHRQVPGLG